MVEFWPVESRVLTPHALAAQPRCQRALKPQGVPEIRKMDCQIQDEKQQKLKEAAYGNDQP